MNWESSSLESLFQKAVQSASRFYSDPSSENTTKLDQTLLEVIGSISSVDPTARLTLNQSSLNELLNYVPILLSSSSTNAITRSKLLRLLFNLGQYNVSLRRYMAADLQLCGPVFECLKQSLKEQLGPQNMIDILRLLQVLTYEKTFTLGIWTNELISFLLKELSMEVEMEWLPYSMAILCNLATRSKSLSQRIRKSSSYKEFARRLTKLLQHDSRIVVVSSLVLIGFLEEKLRELIYCPQNIAQTFQCVFNVLILGDTLMTRHIAADLLKRLVVSETPSVSSTPTLSSTGKDLMNYSYFTRCLQQTADLLVRADPRTEESTKIYDVLLALCSVPSMRSTVCLAILNATPTEDRLTTPLLSIAGTARKSFEEAIDPNVPLKALRLLNYLLKEAVEANRKLRSLIPEDRLLSIIDCAVKTPIQTSDPHVISQCSRITEGLRLAEGISGDDSLRSRLLVEVLPSPLCARLMETQFLSNPVVLFMAKPPSMRSPQGIPEWSMEGVAIVVELIRVLATFKDYSKAHKVQYWSSLKDDRLIPFLAFSISRGSPSIVNQALVLYTHCAQNHEFASQNLADLVSSCTIEGDHPSTSKGEMNEGKERGRRSNSIEERDHKRLNENDSSSNSNGERSKSQLDELIVALKSGLDLKNPKTSDLLAAYENKLAMIQMREQELERLVSTKDAALQQSERLRIQYAASGGRSSDTDLARIRSLVTDCEELKEEKEKIEREMEKKEKEIVEMGKEKRLVLREVEEEKGLNSTLRRNIDEFKAKMEKMSKAVLQLQEQVAAANAENEKKKDEIFKLNEERKSREKLMEEMKGRMESEKEEGGRKIEKLETELEELRIKIETTEKERDEFRLKYEAIQEKMEERKRKMREEMMRLAGEF